MTRPAWNRVSGSNPCPVCKRPDWCLVAAGGTAAICPRTESAKRCGDAGWLHRLAESDHEYSRPRVRRVPLAATPASDFAALADHCRRAADPGRLAAFATSLGLSAGSLTSFGVGWSVPHGAWSFPMTDPASGRATGVRLRRPDGRKFAVTGSKDGLFLPADHDPEDRRLILAEGPTDAAALFDLGFRNVAGRPSCAGARAQAIELTRLRNPSEVVLFADGDDPGRQGAERLAAALAVYTRSVRVMTPPAGVKDARAWKQAGATAADIEQVLSAGAIRRLAVQTREVRRG